MCACCVVIRQIVPQDLWKSVKNIKPSSPPDYFDLLCSTSWLSDTGGPVRAIFSSLSTTYFSVLVPPARCLGHNLRALTVAFYSVIPVLPARNNSFRFDYCLTCLSYRLGGKHFIFTRARLLRDRRSDSGIMFRRLRGPNASFAPA